MGDVRNDSVLYNTDKNNSTPISKILREKIQNAEIDLQAISNKLVRIKELSAQASNLTYERHR
jgi:hypothetical protein